ncbi:MAG: TIR domain-containing protein [Caldilineaceae bacterium]|nr:TIR domain-containing protein [Caldilineaceae bacterium]
MSKQYEIALSFAGEQRAYVEGVAIALQSRGISVFYDAFELVELWGKDLTEELHDVYENRAALAVMFISEHYVEKAWPTLERQSILSRAVQERSEYVLPVRFDDTPVPGLPSSINYVSSENHTPAELAAMIAEKSGSGLFAGKASDVPPPRMTSLIGEAVFDYSGCNGRYVIGRDLLKFETAWSKASDRTIHVYNDPPSINGVARALGCTSIAMVSNAAEYDYTSRSRTIPRGEIAVLRNVHGFYAAVHVLDIKDDSRNDKRDELRFRYAIQPDGSDSFSEFNDEKSP